MLDVARIDAPLSLRAGRLFIEECDTVELARTFGTPLYVHSEGQLRRNARRFRDALKAGWDRGPVHVLPSIKANYSLALRHILTDEGMGCDTFGPGELYAAVHAGVEPRLISVNGSVKDAELITRAIEIGAKITLDSARELDLVVRAAEELGRRAVVRFRVRPDYVQLDRPTDFSEEPVPIREAARQYKPGIPTADLIPLGRRALGLAGVEVAGVMAHLGRHHRDLDVWRGMISAFVATIVELSDAWDGWTPREIDVGGGFATRRDPTGKLLSRLEDRPEAAPSIEDYAATVARALGEELRARSLKVDGVALEIEPGRSLYADTGIHLTTVRNVKREAGAIPWCWIETDTTEMFLLDSLIEHNRWAPVVCDRADAPATQRADIVGKSCGFDVIVRQAAVPNVDIGDVIAILDTGAYEDAASTNFNALPRPATVLVHEASAEVIKRAETLEDVFHRDVVPDRLRNSAAEFDG